MKIAVITVLFRTPEHEVDRLKKEIARLGFPDYEAYFIDNTGKNKGFAAGVNEGLLKGMNDGADCFLILNPDISLKGLSADGILSGKDHFDIWGLSMVQDGKTYYGGEIERWRMSGGLIEMRPKQRYCPVDYVTGSFMFIKRAVVERMGCFDESYFMYYEDVDYCERGRRAGFRVGIDAGLSYLHLETSKTYEGKRYQMAKNRIIFLMKYGSIKQKLRELIRSPKTIIEDRVLWMTALKSAFFVSFLSLNASAFIAKGLNFLLFLAFIRYVPVRDYGIYTLVWAHVTLLSPLVDFGTTSYGMVYLPREKKSRMQSIFSLRLVLSIIVFILTLILGVIFRYPARTLSYIFLTSFVLFFNMVSGTYMIVSSINGQLVRNSVISTVTNTVMVLTLIFAVIRTGSLTSVFYLIAVFYSLYALVYFLLVRSSVGELKLTFNWKEWFEVIRKSYAFILISLFAGIYFKIDVFILNFMKGAAAVGTYSSGYKFFEAMMLLVSSYNTLSTPILSRTVHNNKRKLMPTIAKHFLFLLAIGVGIVMITDFFGSLFLPYILKGNYAMAVDVVEIVIWALPFMLFNSILLNLLYAADLSYLVVFIFLAISMMNGVLNFMLIPHFSFIASSYITVISEMVDFAVLLFIVFVFYRKRIFYD